MKIGILQTGPVPDDLVETHGQYPEMFVRMLKPFGFEFATWPVLDGTFPDSVEDAHGWLITGSRHGVYEDHDWLPPLRDFVRRAYAAERPLVGICFGHQLIAQALGGQVEKFANGWSVGPTTYHFPDGDKVIHAYHQDQVITPPEGAQTIAHSDFCKHAALYYPGRAYSVQPHPEFDDSYTRALLETRGPGVVPDDRLAKAAADLGTPLNSPEIAQQIARFFRERTIQ
ncbi:type 1 glutamine amidotransferase [Sagittula sp. SSi028]|uniref:type 1 glutamine amidotransferase n=1 Tax=Sagittula sp. SSi028 TaxID=3400636 RepID=UPI003AF7D1CE